MIAWPTLAAVRFGYGFRPLEPQPPSPADMLGSLQVAARETPRFPIEGIEQRLTTFRETVGAMRGLRLLPKDEAQRVRRQRRQGINQLVMNDAHARIAQAVLSQHGFYERLATFWTDHFAVSSKKGYKVAGMVAVMEAQAIRPHITGRFADMLVAVSTHPAMLVFLDQASSIGPTSAIGRRTGKGLNENLAREILELHTLGVNGGYGQNDVREFARLLTGLTESKDGTRHRYDAKRAESGSKTVFGRGYGAGGMEEIIQSLNDLAMHPNTARHLASKLVTHFISDAPQPALSERLTQAYLANGGALMPLYEILLNAPEASQFFGAKARQPFDFVVAGLRALGASGEMLAPRERRPKPGQAMQMANSMMGGAGLIGANPLTVASLRDMGQPVWAPGGPDGFEEGFANWVSPKSLADRIAWATRVSQQVELGDPRAFLEATLGASARPDTRFANSAAASRIEGAVVVLASPEFNRR